MLCKVYHISFMRHETFLFLKKKSHIHNVYMQRFERTIAIVLHMNKLITAEHFLKGEWPIPSQQTVIQVTRLNCY